MISFHNFYHVPFLSYIILFLSHHFGKYIMYLYNYVYMHIYYIYRERWRDREIDFLSSHTNDLKIDAGQVWALLG